MSEDRLPRHAHLRDYLQAHPVEGYDHRAVIDRSDGLGPRAVGWPDRVTPPLAADIDAWVAQRSAAQKQADDAKAARRTTLQAVRDGSGAMTNAQITAVLRVLAREVLGDA